ncbi:MAG: hypothetical protein Q8936_21970 [Bacillota bacterium]|nr:hypothetical protein [Bacillota bacterium]
MNDSICTSISVNLNEKADVKLSEEREAIGEKYRSLSIGLYISIHGPTEIFEKLFSILDKTLHDTTYFELDTEKLRLETKLETVEEENEQLREIIEQRRRI